MYARKGTYISFFGTGIFHTLYIFITYIYIYIFRFLNTCTRYKALGGSQVEDFFAPCPGTTRGGWGTSFVMLQTKQKT